MAQKNRILLTFDGSEVSRSAYGQASAIARAMNAEILLLRVHQAPARVWVEPEAERREEELRKLMEGWERDLAEEAAGLERAAGVKVEPVCRRLGERWAVPDEILAVADEFDPILLVMASRGEKALRHFLLGSTALSVLSRSRRPVVLVAPEIEAAE